ncbi:fibronectin type III domain-containing protein [Microbacterium hominis]|uniref:fibronectin type III domain-containing protein n=1 Tax=Microbacterium hominis TaxID=162426 RepID=UPI00196444D1|nr:fibronectin type III domain-containing protein [Microbacterium hominis]QRY40844.1 fibronectin type III domain-containing protein [Microbacterium hominis]
MGTATFSGNGNYYLDVDAAVSSQNQGGNYSTIYWRAIAVKTSGSGYWSAADGGNNWDGWSNVGDTGAGSGFAYDFRGSTPKSILIAEGTFNLGHDANGYANFEAACAVNLVSIGGATAYSGVKSAPRIPKAPQTPGTPSIGTVTPSTAALSWAAPDNMGSGISTYRVQYATNGAFTAGVGSQDFGSNSGTVTGLTPGQTYWFRVAALNGVGWSGYSGASSTLVGLPAPTLTSWAQNSDGALVATWTAPSITTGLTGYRLLIARDEGFTQGVSYVDVGNQLSTPVAGLAGGRQYFAKVAARTSGGVNTYSNALSTMLVLAAGDLDGWTRVGTKPAQISYYTAEGLRRGSVGTSPALYLESISTASTTLAADTYGIQKTVSGLTVGKAYRFEAQATLTSTSALADSYRLSVVSESNGTPVNVTSTATTLPAVEFVADATSVQLRVMLSEGIAVSGAQDAVENVAVHSIRLLQLATDFPQRLRATVYESNLANHFDLACNSVGATWYVGKDGITRFRLPGSALPVSAIFSDDATPGAVSYVDIQAGYDTRTTVNRIEATNYGRATDEDVEENDELIVEDTASQLAYGVYRSTLALNLYDEAPYDDSFSDRLTSLLTAYKTPKPRVSSVRWNAQENLPLATALDVGQRITVHYSGADYDSQIVAIQHDFVPTRWLVTLTLQPL